VNTSCCSDTLGSGRCKEDVADTAGENVVSEVGVDDVVDDVVAEVVAEVGVDNVGEVAAERNVDTYYGGVDSVVGDDCCNC
jgi:hypothetical protein